MRSVRWRTTIPVMMRTLQRKDLAADLIHTVVIWAACRAPSNIQRAEVCVMRQWLVSVFWVSCFSGCAAPKPILYPNAHYQRSGPMPRRLISRLHGAGERGRGVFQ